MTVATRCTIRTVIADVVMETPDIVRLKLVSENGGGLPQFAAGAHVDVEAAPDIVRQYSLMGEPTNTESYMLGVKKEVHSRGGSIAVHETARAGARLKISLPKNNFELAVGEARHLLFAGGIGVTPLVSMARELHKSGADFQMHYFVRSNDDLAFRDLIAESGWMDRVVFHLGIVPPVLEELLGDLLRNPGRADQIYMCGPAPFMDCIEAISATCGWQADQIKFERFSAAPPLVGGESDGFVVRLASNGREITVGPEQTIIEALRENGIEIETSCEQGICGTCVTRLIEGTADHRDLYLSEEEQEKEGLFAPCVSRALSKYLVLDL